MKILLVEDNESIRCSLSDFLKNLGHQVLSGSNGEEALKALENETVHLVLTDIRMPYMDGHELLRRIKNSKKYKNCEVIMFTGQGDIKSAVQAMKDGAYEYLLKPIDVNELALIIKRVSDYLSLKEENIKLTRDFDRQVKKATKNIKEELDAVRLAFAREVGTAEIGIFSNTLKEVFETAGRLHKNPEIPVLIEGETGTGKEVIARFIHYGMGDVVTPFVGLNCAAISLNLFESELFGYEAGAFTGGNPKGQKGKLELAEGGTIFFDEITEMPVEHQTKLLRVIQEREFYKVGGIKRLNTNARFICATNRNIEEKVKEGTFREDLYFRLNVGHIRIPPLRDRKEEILPLALMFLKNLSDQGKTRFESISHGAQKILKEHAWTGNIRELKNTIERIVLHWDESEILPDHLDFLFKGIKSSVLTGTISQELDIEEIILPENNLDINRLNLKIVKKALEKFKGNKTDTALYLGISRKALYTYLKKMNGN